MPHGYYLIEQWKRSAKDGPASWTVILQLPFGATLAAARVVQTQRVIWAEEQGGGLKLRTSYSSSPGSLDQMHEMFERGGGRYPHEEVRAARRLSKTRKAL